MQVSAFTDNHLPQPDVKGWRKQQRAALREAQAVTHAALQGVLPQQVALQLPLAGVKQ